MSDIRKINNTDTIPLVDELVYYSKIICRDLEIKDQNKANLYETVESVKNSDLYIKCVENKATISNFIYTYDELISYGLDKKFINEYIKDPTTIPKTFHSKIISIRTNSFLESYNELNNYYRMLDGLPDIGDEGILVPDGLIDMTIYHDSIDLSKKIHEMTKDEQDVLLILDVINTIIESYPKAKYLKHIGSNKISIYRARKALEFQLLFIPTDIPIEISRRFETEYEINRQYIMKRVYSEAYKYQSDHYDSFIAIFIIISTLCDVFSKVPDFFIKGDIFDLKTIKLIFESNGIDYFPNIPKKYQLAMVRNLNRLKKYKASYQSIVDISSLFGFDNIEIFKYYILKERLTDKNGAYVFNEEDSDNYDLKFIKVPIDGVVDDYINEPKNILAYNEITDQDRYWDGQEDHNYIRQKIIDYEFNILRTQYLSIDTVYSMTELSFEISYFYNMLFDDVILEDKLMIKVPTISTIVPFKFTDILCYMFALGYMYMGISDNILYKPSEVLTIHGFNFKANMEVLGNYIANKGYTLEQLGITDFQIPKTSLLTYNQLLYVFTQNRKIYNHLYDEMRTADNKDIYDIYKSLYDALMITEVNMDFFKKSDGTVATGYTDYIKDKNKLLYKSIQDIRSIKDDDERISKIANMINDIVYIIESYMDTKEFKYLWYRIPTVSAESIKMYLYEVINFFKSYKTTILNINTIYKFDDKLDNAIGIIDKIRINYELHKRDMLDIIDNILCNVYYNKSDKLDFKEQLYINARNNKPYTHNEFIDIVDKIASMYVSLHKKSNISISDVVNMVVNMNKRTYLDIKEVLFINGNKIDLEEENI